MGETPVIDLDHNATTKPLPEVLETMVGVMRDAYANPGSQHQLGRAARRVLEQSRETIAEILDAEPEEICFTSGGTESTNLALFGLARGQGTILTGPGEHLATRETAGALAQRGWKWGEFPVDPVGRLINPESLLEATPATRLVSCLLAHNETGVIQEVKPLVGRCNALGIPTHLDAVQAVGKIPVSFRELGATAMSFAAHKFHGPRGIGGLVIRRGVRLGPLHFGGHQEEGRRPGTEAVPLIAGMTKALSLWRESADERSRQMAARRDFLEAELERECPPVEIHGAATTRLPNTASIAFPGLEGEALLVALDLAGVACSLGSTCASGSADPAPILLAMGVPREKALSTIRFSVGWETTEEEIQEAVRRIVTVVRRLRGV